jgi:hypothetical protein
VESIALARDCDTSGWKVLYRDDLDQDRASRSNPSREGALEQAKELYLKGRAEIYRIEGPDGATLRKQDIMRWLCANKH